MKIDVLIAEIQAVGESIKSDELQVFPEAASPNVDYVRQGDVFIKLLDGIPEGFEVCEPIAQLAPGSTMGSRHILSHTDLEMYINPNANALTGPVIKVSREVIIKHPQHGDWKLGPNIYGITYERMMADEIKRVVD